MIEFANSVCVGGGGEIVRKVKHSLVRIENPLSALYRGTEYFSLARTFRTAWGGLRPGKINERLITNRTHMISL